MTDLAIDLHDVTKTFPGKVQALRGVQMQVRPGEIFGLLGPNGAGKSTLVKIIMTVVRPSRAQGTVLGRSVGHKPSLRRIGYLPEHHRFPRYLTGRQAIEFFGGLCGMPRPQRRRRAEELLDVVRMTEWAGSPIGTYSKGMQQRIGLAAALVNDPDLVLLDEPTDGVDPVGRREIRDVLLSLRQRGCAVLLNSHLLSELEMVCDRVAIMVQGKVVSQGTIDELTAESFRYEIVFAGSSPTWAGEGGLSLDVLREDRCRISIAGTDPESIQPTIDRLRAERRTIVAITQVRESLEDLFMRAVVDLGTGRTSGPGAYRPGAARTPPPPPLAAQGGSR